MKGEITPGDGVLPEKFKEGCGPLPKTLTLPIYDPRSNIRYTLFTAVASNTVALNIIYEGLLFICSLRNFF